MTEKEGFKGGPYVENLPATMASTGESPGLELTGGADRPVDIRHRVHGGLRELCGARDDGWRRRVEQRPLGNGDAGDADRGAAWRGLGLGHEGGRRSDRRRAHPRRDRGGAPHIETQVNRAGETLSSVLRDLQARVDGTLKKK